MRDGVQTAVGNARTISLLTEILRNSAKNRNFDEFQHEQSRNHEGLIMNFSPLTKMPVSALALTATVALLSGCAGTPPPTEQMAVAEATVKNASTSSTKEAAAGELQIAIAKLASAREAMARKDYLRAGQLAEQAELDARIAELHAQSAHAKKAADESMEAGRVLNEEINRKSVR